MFRPALACLLLAASNAVSTHGGAARAGLAAGQNANPIRRVVTLLQKMQKQVAEEGKTEEELYKKFMCYCSTGKGQLSTSISTADEKITKVTSMLEEGESKKAQLDSDIKKAKADRAEGKTALATATSLRAKAATAYAKESSDFQTDLSALTAAIKAIETGMAGSFLQTQAGSVLRRLAVDVDMSAPDRDMLTAFLAQGQGYVPKSGQIVGILKEMKDTMGKDLGDLTAAEEKAIKDYEALSAAKTAEIEALTTEIESKLQASGELAVDPRIVDMKEDLDDTGKALLEDKKFLAELERGCATKTAEWEERSKTRTDELLALAETIKILNDDDALESNPAHAGARAAGGDEQAGADGGPEGPGQRQGPGSPRGAHLPRAPRRGEELRQGHQDDMVVLLGEEQAGDDKKKAYCEKSLDESEDDKKVLENTVGDLEKSIATTEESISTLAEATPRQPRAGRWRDGYSERLE
ncbi:unnamed protein product [Prorocentrum cordatum]|uniref:Uncharacterized protein n=1 Tax=Prorocentrum cordatum TaxID=2364126 RepID=A0ABN9VR52_9DINO|nr:unnamed protein product [Polarella glacialis]